jgi:pilus assembly protein FimV
MKSINNSRVTVLGLALLCVVLDANALALGRARSAVLVGQPLSLTVPVQLGADEDVSALCIDADVFYGDIRQERTHVAVTTSPAAQGQSALVRIVSKGIVDEPVVTVELRAGCSFKTSRRYVLLADMASTVDAPVVVSAIGARPQPLSLTPATAIAIPSTIPSTTPRPGKVAGTARKTTQGTVRAASTRTGSDTTEAASARAAASGRRVTSGKATQKSRLKLTAIDLRVERDPVLRSTDLLLGLPLEDLEKRAQAIATWRALNATPEEVLRQDARASSVDADLKMLKDVTAKNQQALVSLAGRLEEAQSQRFRNPLVYALALGLLACLVALVYLFLRIKRSYAGPSPWWRGDDDSRIGLSQMSEFTDSVQPREAYAAPVDPAPPGDSQYVLRDPATDGDGVNVDLGFTASQAASLFSDPMQGAAPHKVEPSMSVPPSIAKRPGSAQRAAAALSSINTREVLDVRQQAEFFVTLGQHDDAVHMLEYSINNSVDSNPLVYLDLLTVLHTLSRKDEFERYRVAFNGLFSGRVPPYAQFSEKGHRLEVYHDVCAHVVGLWPSEAAQNFIEHCLVRTNDGLLQEFDLNAYEDLLTLYGVLRRLIIGSESGFVPFSAARSLAEPGAYSDVGAAGPADHARTVPIQTTGAPDMGVDLDLSDGPDNLIEFDEPTLSLTPIKPGH